MKITLRSMEESDRTRVLEMMRIFYASEAVLSCGSEEIFNNDITACISNSPYLEGLVFERSGIEAASLAGYVDGSLAGYADGSLAGYVDGSLAGYAMLAHSFSTEFGRPCVWIEDLYLEPDARGLGLGKDLLAYVAARYPDAVHRLEAERENRRALDVYRRSGFEELPYIELIRNR